jgi:tellurium resistance protein TerD
MAISLKKGGNVNLSKETPSLKKIMLGLGWDPRETEGVKFDLDASAFMLNSSGKVRNDSDFIFYNNKRSIEGSVVHAGDNTTGGGDGDDEQISVDLNAVPVGIERISFAVTIHEAEIHRLNFGMVRNCYIRCVNNDSGVEIARFDLTEDGSLETAMIFGELYRYGSEWKFKAIAQGFTGGLGPLADSFGVNIQ